MGDQDPSTVFLKTMSNYMIQDGNGFKSLDNVTQEVETLDVMHGVLTEFQPKRALSNSNPNG